MIKEVASIDVLFRYCWHVIKNHKIYFDYITYAHDRKHIHATPNYRMISLLLKLDMFDPLLIVKHLLMIVHRPESISQNPVHPELLDFILRKK